MFEVQANRNSKKDVATQGYVKSLVWLQRCFCTASSAINSSPSGTGSGEDKHLYESSFNHVGIQKSLYMLSWLDCELLKRSILPKHHTVCVSTFISKLLQGRIAALHIPLLPHSEYRYSHSDYDVGSTS